MEYGSTAIQVGLMLLVSIIGSIITTKVRESVMNERLQNTRNDLEALRQHVATELDKAKTDMNDIMSNCQRNQSDRMTIAMDYIRRVETSKADKSEVLLVIDTMRRVEQKLDQLMINLSNTTK